VNLGLKPPADPATCFRGSKGELPLPLPVALPSCECLTRGKPPKRGTGRGKPGTPGAE
jgi:hypothetical protein